MVFVYFVLAAIVTVIASIKLSQYADVISEKTAMGGMMVGTLLLAGATSLPEVSTSFSAAAIGNADIAVGNMIGSNLFNLFILASFDFLLRRRRILERASKDHLYTAFLGLLLTVLVILSLWLRIDISFLGIGLDALIIAIAYIVGMVVINKLQSQDASIEEAAVSEQEPNNPSGDLSAKAAVIRFILAALVVLGTGTALSITGDEIAVITGIGSSFIGSFLIAATTSLPEAISVFVALRLNNVNMAVGAILGSNIFNMIILAISDPVYTAGPILSAVSGAHMIIALGVLAMSLLTIYALTQKKTLSSTVYSVPSILMVIIYFVATFLNFNY
ncbi:MULTISPECIES: sodium:calcium antiporter [unclassified Planococcus (in: firmicutes)]|uniref:sodium:calcium antiporter n=1 Tax=unclassified Planococcus (in: firmicutes) TaxID=2662419 RepID=UPI001F29ECEB|nr:MULTISPECIES: sodium:calcium antiporter [unclassified Planococcus (in: firmicutes)]UJF27876.1 sodium:calcium antiporter [Planococcus sp. 107-1]GKW47505.1 sodium:calcium antiporter [Planococcus sp. NCCP-2050]